ncbi:MAG: HAD hydrolase family protein [bacterium]|nr:HAD hydrolase family protein [Candidatus Kapabacteria bacterium]
MIACDLDGTLLNADNMIGGETARLVRQIIELDIEFVFITARHHFAAEPFADDLRLDETIISLDGALTKCPHENSIIAMNPIDASLMLAVAERVAATPAVDCAFVMADRIHVSRRDMVIPGRHTHWNIDSVVTEKLADVKEPVLEMIASGTFRAINEVYAIVKPREQSSSVRTRLYESDSHGDLWYLEARSIYASKVHALSDYARLRSISMGDVIAIGDERNDVEFCEKAGYTVAVRNAVSRLKEIADYVTERACTEEGINEFLEYFLTVRRQHA